MNKEYRFLGWRSADVKDARGLTPRDYYDLLSRVWCRETCAARMRGEWSEDNKTWGQCTITAFLLQDIYGGRVYGVKLPDGNYHSFNVVENCLFDLTSEQFGDRPPALSDLSEQSRETHFANEEKKLRYELLKTKLAAILPPEKKREETNMEEQIVTVKIKTKGEKCEMTDAEIKEWYASHVAKLFDPAYGTPEIEVELERIEK
ncbi:MAG: hypothetical protein J6X72_05670 [Clostridia bacterium]|nr:hypothetical protein [Clostridia bacterium]